MALKPGKRWPVEHAEMFPGGAYVVGPVEKVTDFDAKKGKDDQKRDTKTDERLWQVSVMDADPDGRAGQREVKIKIAAAVQPVPPSATPGTPFAAVEFTGLAVVPWINEKGMRPKIEFSVYADAMHTPAAVKPAGKAAGNSGTQPAAA